MRAIAGFILFPGCHCVEVISTGVLDICSGYTASSTAALWIKEPFSRNKWNDSQSHVKVTSTCGAAYDFFAIGPQSVFPLSPAEPSVGLTNSWLACLVGFSRNQSKPRSTLEDPVAILVYSALRLFLLANRCYKVVVYITDLGLTHWSRFTTSFKC